MLLLYREQEKAGCPVWYIYIPLCFYFIMKSIPCQCGNSQIYIPLCFYFITTRTHSQKASWSNLHSTMLLLYQTPVGFTPFVSMYLHSTMLLLYHVVLAPCAFSANIFTFHYASTLSSAFLSSFCNFQIIYIPLCFYFIYAPDRTHNKNTYLHSTMLLLYLTRYLLSML